MPSDSINMDDLNSERRKAIAENIQPISVEELKKIGESLFPYFDHPWREKFYTFLDENAGATFHHATTQDNVHVIYCHAKDRGIWFLPGSGMGPLQPKGLKALKDIVEAKR